MFYQNFHIENDHARTELIDAVQANKIPNENFLPYIITII